MQDVIDASGYVNELGHIMVVEFELLKFEEVFNIPEIAGDEIVHADDIISFLDETVTQVRTQETGRPRDEYSLSIHQT